MSAKIQCPNCTNDDKSLIEILYKVYVNEWYNCQIYCGVCSKISMVGPFNDKDLEDRIKGEIT